MTATIGPRLVVEDVDAAIAYYERYLGTSAALDTRCPEAGRARRSVEKAGRDGRCTRRAPAPETVAGARAASLPRRAYGGIITERASALLAADHRRGW
jgi:hypothetical protein